MIRRLRIAYVIVQPVLVWDDGTQLSPGPKTASIEVALPELPNLPKVLLAELDQTQKTLETAP